MTAQAGTIEGVQLVSKTWSGYGAREVYLITASFPAYTGASDTATVTAVGAAVGTHVRDGKTRTLRWAAPAFAGYDTASQSVFYTGTAVQALTISSDDTTGQLSAAAGTELTSSTASVGVGFFVGIDVS